MTSITSIRKLGVAALWATIAVPVAASAQDESSQVQAELVRQVLAAPDDGAAWSALESGAATAADRPFVLRRLQIDPASGGLALELGGYGLPTLEQISMAGEPTRVVVHLPGARSAVPHGFELGTVGGFSNVQVRQAPNGVDIEARLATGEAAILDETDVGVRVRNVGLPPAAATLSAGPVAGGSVVAYVLRRWVDGLRAGRPLAVFPLAAVGSLALLLASWLALRRRPTGRMWHSVTDAERLAQRMSVPRDW